jgi:SRSO17 transposase
LNDTEFLAALPEDLYYFAAIASSTLLCRRKPNLAVPEYGGRGRPPIKARRQPGQDQPLPVSKLVGRLRFKSVHLGESAKGPLWAKVACSRVYRGDEEHPRWLFVRKNQDGTIKYALSNAPADTRFKTLCQVSLMRWPIEQCFQEGKSQLGMNHYEHRSWPAWHRHMTYVFLALHFLMRLRIRLKKSPHADAALNSAVAGFGAAAEISDGERCHADRAISLEAQSGGLYLSPEKADCFG